MPETVQSPVGLRSDTVTRPTPAMRQAMAEAEVGDDVFGEDPGVNGLLRRFLPKGTRFKAHTHEQLDRITQKLNNRPRKCLGYPTPGEVFQLQREVHFRALRT